MALADSANLFEIKGLRKDVRDQTDRLETALLALVAEQRLTNRWLAHMADTPSDQGR